MFAVVQNDPEVPAGSCTTILAAAAQKHRLIRAYGGAPLPAPGRFTGVIVLGGAMGVHEVERFPCLAEVQSFMSEALSLDVPLLGICLGGQLLAQVAGGSVTAPSPHAERGIDLVSLAAEGGRDPIFAGVPPSFTTFQWHEDSFLPPPSATLLASSARCPWQAFRLRSTAYGVQFHPEVDRVIVSNWSSSSPNRREILASFDSARGAFEAHCHAILANFVRLALDHGRP